MGRPRPACPDRDQSGPERDEIHAGRGAHHREGWKRQSPARRRGGPRYGAGIAPEFRDKIFDPFFRITQTRSSVKGLGLGLSIVRTLVELHGGTIEARNSDGKGAELYFTLPLRYPVEGGVHTVSKRAPRILVVDDDKDIRQLLDDRLVAMGYEVETETDGLRALKAIGTGRFSGVILDIGISSVDGMDVLKQIRQDDAHIPIIMVTAS